MRRSEGPQNPSGTTTCAGWFAASAGVAATWCKLVPHLNGGVSGSPGAGEFFIEFANVSSSKVPKNGKSGPECYMYFITSVWLDLI